MPHEAHRSFWKQVNISWSSDHTAEQAAVSLLAPALMKADAERLMSCWFFIRKGEWRLRYLPARGEMAGQVESFVEQVLGEMADTGQVETWVPGIIYEPETNAFGGTEGMDMAHELFHADSAQILGTFPAKDKRRELSLLLCTALMRAARLDWYEQGDVWDRVVKHRPWREDETVAERQDAFDAAVKKLITADTRPAGALRRQGGTMEATDGWFAAFDHVGEVLGELACEGMLTRGLRAIIAHHILFHWNRLGLSYATQARLAKAARDAVFDKGLSRSMNLACDLSGIRRWCSKGAYCVVWGVSPRFVMYRSVPIWIRCVAGGGAATAFIFGVEQTPRPRGGRRCPLSQRWLVRRSAFP